MLFVEASSKVIGSYKQKAQICFQEIQQEIESSYNGINDVIDKKFAFSDLGGAKMSTSPINVQIKSLEIPSQLNFLK
ncbi:unnamed protein product [Paramecium sonneborni]|uniref:Uncharacterized protein n=1 Tax=Paramecium sonneborni TaxID=65129 RepID=A0A8S1RXT1_9CILI|nr:unnamed protein product [Paramecium sonneborni]